MDQNRRNVPPDTLFFNVGCVDVTVQQTPADMEQWFSTLWCASHGFRLGIDSAGEKGVLLF